MKWTNVKYKLPDENQKVLITNNLKAKDACGDMSHIWIGLIPQKDGKIAEAMNGITCAYKDEFMGELIYNPTHWMPIPTASGYDK